LLQNDLVTAFNSQLRGQTTSEGPSRRTALKTALGVGYAVAAMPIVAQTAINTPSNGLNVGEVNFEVNGFKVPMYFAAPAGKKNLPVVLVIQEIFGVHAHIADVCRRFAKAGYLAIAPELYARQGDPSCRVQSGPLEADCP
jgi:carboxymethylenebutenolidase